MSVQFILGRAGSGKTRYLLDQMTSLVKAEPLGPPIFWLLPRQATFQGERLLTAKLGAFSRVRVVSFDQLGKEILTHCGDIDIPQVTARGRRLVIGHLLRLHQKQLKFYTRSANRPGLASELDWAFGELERAGLDAATLDELRHTMDSPAALDLRDKLFDLHLLMQQYNQYVGQERLDPQRRLSLILKRAAGCSFLRNARIFVDDFFDFTSHERKLLTAVTAIASRTVVSLLIDSESAAVTNPSGILPDLSTFHRTERTYHALLTSLKDAAVSIDPPILLQQIHRYQSPDLMALEKNLFGSETNSDGVAALECMDAPDARIEVDAVARRIKSAVAGGMRYRQIGVLVRNLAEYQEIVHASFSEHGLPWFADHRRPAVHHPLLQLVRASLQIARHKWPVEGVLSLVKSGLAGLSDNDSDELENYVLRHRIRGRMWESPEPWLFVRNLIRTEDEFGLPILTETDRVDQHRRSLWAKLTPVLELGRSSKPQKVREIAARIFSVLDGFDARTQLLKWIDHSKEAGDLERASEHEQVWSEFVQLLDHLVELLGDESISLPDFMSVLDSGLESFDLALAPPKVDQILLGQIDRTRPPELKMVFVLGLNEGSFPRVAVERSVISDRERRTLRSRNIDLDHDSERRLLDERFLAYLAFTRASHQLILSRPTADAAGRSTNPSGFWLEILRAFPGVNIQHLTRSSQSNADHIGTPRQLVTALLRWVRKDNAVSGSETGIWPRLYQWLATASLDVEMSAIRDQAWRSLAYNNLAKLDDNTAHQLFPSPLNVRVSELESMAACPFQHFARFGLSLRARERTEVTGMDLSNAYHDILENLVRDLLETKTDWCGLKPPQAKEMIAIHAAEIGRKLRGELMLSTSRNGYLLDRIERSLELAVANMCELHRRGKYRPTHAGISFGDGQEIPAYEMTTPAGRPLKIRGKMDRLDFNEKKAAFVLTDYKLSAGPLQLDRVHHGLSLQLLTYLLVIQANSQQLAGRKLSPAAAFLLQLLRTPQLVDHPSQAVLPDDPAFNLRNKPRGLIERRALSSLDKNLTEGASDVVNAYLTKSDGGIGHRNQSDVAEPAEVEALLKLVQKRLGELADEILTGKITVAPYMMDRQTPCARCEFRSVCRFEPGLNRYRILNGMKREEVLDAAVGK